MECTFIIYIHTFLEFLLIIWFLASNRSWSPHEWFWTHTDIHCMTPETSSVNRGCCRWIREQWRPNFWLALVGALKRQGGWFHSYGHKQQSQQVNKAIKYCLVKTWNSIYHISCLQNNCGVHYNSKGGGTSLSGHLWHLVYVYLKTW